MGVQEVYGEDHSKYIDALEQVQSVEKQVHASLQHPSLAYIGNMPCHVTSCKTKLYEGSMARRSSMHAHSQSP